MASPATNGKDHLRWCADRALEEFDDYGAAGALATVMTDFKEHPATAKFSEGLIMATVGPASRLGRQQLEEAIMGFRVQ